MMSTIKDRKVTGPGDSDPQGPAGVGGTVPAPPPSSSDVGLPLESTESSRGELTISSGEAILADGFARAFSGLRKGPGTKKGDPGPKTSPVVGAGKKDCPGPSSPEPGCSGTATRDAEFRRPGPLSSKRKERRYVTDGDSSSDGMSVSGGDFSALSDMSTDTCRAVVRGEIPYETAAKKRGRGRPPTTGEWVGVEAVRKELEQLKAEHARVVMERDVLAGRIESSFGATAGGIPSADDLMRALADDSTDSLVNLVLDEMTAVDGVAERSGSLKGTLQGKLRAASRRSVAAVKLLFARACAGEGASDGGALERARREISASRTMAGEREAQIRALKKEVETLKAREATRAKRTRRSLPRSRRTPSSFTGAELGGDSTEQWDSPGSSPSRGDPPARKAPPKGPPEMDPVLLHTIECVVERAITRHVPRVVPPDQPPAPPRGPPCQPPTPAPAPQREAAWRKVVGRKAGKKGTAPKQPPKQAALLPSPPVPGGKKKKKGRVKKGPGKGPEGGPKPVPQKKKTPAGVVREPRTAAVLLTVAPEAGATLAGVLRECRPAASTIPGLAGVVLKKAQAGGYLLQIPGGDGHRIADDLAAEMRRIVGERPGVRVARPVKRAELRVCGLDDSITKEEFVESVTGLTGCRADDLSVGEIRFLPHRMGSVWLRCPVAVSNKLLETGKWRIGLAMVTAKPLPARRMRCFRCLEVGHGAAGCRRPDRSGRCYRCSDRSHQVRECSAGRLRCPLCADFGLPADHALGAASCTSSEKTARRKLAVLAKEKARKKGEESREDQPPPTEGTGGGSKGGPRGAKPPETSAPASPGGQESGSRPTAGEVPASSAPKKGATASRGGRTLRSSLKRTVASRSPSRARRRAEELGTEATPAEEHPTMPPPDPPTPPAKRRDRRGRFKQ